VNRLGKRLLLPLMVGAANPIIKEEMIKMKWRLLFVVPLLTGILLCPGVIYADDGGDLDVDIGIIGNNVDVDIGIDANDVDVNMDINSGNTDVFINGKNISSPTIIRRGGGNGPNPYRFFRAMEKRLAPIYSWMEDRDGVIGLTIDGLAKVILTISGQDSILEEQSSILDKQEGEIAALKSSIDNRISSLENQLALSIQHVEGVRIIYNRNIVILFGITGALAITSMVAIIKIRKISSK